MHHCLEYICIGDWSLIMLFANQTIICPILSVIRNRTPQNQTTGYHNSMPSQCDPPPPPPPRSPSPPPLSPPNSHPRCWCQWWQESHIEFGRPWFPPALANTVLGGILLLGYRSGCSNRLDDDDLICFWNVVPFF